jgi:hypothetical protein
VSHDEEIEVTSKELDAVRKNAGRSKCDSFEQLRSNQEDDDEKKAELERSRMRGVRALDEDDVAHLNGLNRSKVEGELQRKMEMEHEMALFRAAKEERLSGHVVVDEDGDKEKETFEGTDGVSAAAAAAAAIDIDTTDHCTQSCRQTTTKTSHPSNQP